MTLLASLFEQPKHNIVQKSRKIPLDGVARVAEKQDRPMPLNTAAQKAGVRYEKQVGKYLERITATYDCELHSHVWFEKGDRLAQTDFFLTFPSYTAILFEVKQTWVDTSDQLAFYKHILTEIGFASVTCCTICKNLTSETPRDTIIRSFEDIKENATWQIRL